MLEFPFQGKLCSYYQLFRNMRQPAGAGESESVYSEHLQVHSNQEQQGDKEFRQGDQSEDIEGC